MPANIEIKASKTITTERICTALEDNGSRLVNLYARSDDIFKELAVHFIFYTIVQGNVEGVVRARVGGVRWAGGIQTTSAREKVLLIIFMKRDGQNTISRPKGLFYPVTVVNIDVYIEYTRMVEEQLENGENNIIDIAEARCFRLFGVVKAAGPIYCNVGLVRGEFSSCVERGSGVKRAVLVEAIENRAIVTNVVPKSSLLEFGFTNVEGGHTEGTNKD